ncbi:hypothetical protein KAS79_01915 [Candidatus Parcubacteria bacterium]|nr:hypothetical protein [Candidatus Parcubacteria bacterium]
MERMKNGKSEDKNVKIGVSLASYLPWSAYWPETTARWAEEDGFCFLGVLPFREIKRLSRPELPVLFAEKAWNPVDSLIPIIFKKPTKEEKLVPQLWDWLFFPGIAKAECLFHWILSQYQATIVCHSFKDLSEGRLLEVSPGLGMTPEEIVETAQKYRKSLVIDLCHLREKFWISENGKKKSLLGHWQKSLPLLLPYTSLIHVQPYMKDNEAEKILRGEENEIKNMLDIIDDIGYSGPYLVEATLRTKSWNIFRLRKMLRAVRNLVTNPSL